MYFVQYYDRKRVIGILNMIYNEIFNPIPTNEFLSNTLFSFLQIHIFLMVKIL